MRQASVSRGFLILSRTNLIIKLISILYVPILLAIIGPAGHGDYALAYVYYGALVALLSDAIVKTMIRRVSSLEVKHQVSEAISFTKQARQLTVKLSLGLALLVVLFSPLLANLLHAPHVMYSFMVLGVSLVFAGLGAVYRAYFQATRRMDVAARAMLMEQVINAVLTIGLSWLLVDYGLGISLAGAAAGTLMGGLISAVYLHRYFSDIAKPYAFMPSGYDVLLLIKPLLGVSLALQIGSMLEAAVVKLRLSGLGLNATLASMAYSDITSYKMAQSIPMLLISAMATALYPAITESVAQGDIRRFYRRIEQALRNHYIITIPAAFGIALVARELVTFAFDGRLQREQLILGGAFMIILMGIGLIQSIILQADGRMLISQLPLVASVFIQMIAAILFIKAPFGVYGVLIAGYVGLFSLCVANHLVLKHRQLKLNYTRDIPKPLVASLIMSGVILGLKLGLGEAASRTGNLVHLLLMALVGSIVYFVALLLLGGITLQDVTLVSPGWYDRMPAGLKRFISDKK